jgi:hypothetical protein
MHETPDDLAALQDLLDRSYAGAGPHLRRIITPERRLTAEQVSDRLTGMWEHDFLDSGPAYARIEPDRMFTFHMPADG